MLSSLFGELRSLRTIRSDGHGPDDSGFAATALMESTATEVNDHGQMVDHTAIVFDTWPEIAGAWTGCRRDIQINFRG
ncbi:MAG: hypothetical protein ACM32J_05025, partial [Rhizobacter sp.]